jgi:hypothetical protein
MDNLKWFYSEKERCYYSVNKNNSGRFLVAVREPYSNYKIIKTIANIPESVLDEVRRKPDEVWKIELIIAPFVKKANGGRPRKEVSQCQQKQE